MSHKVCLEVQGKLPAAYHLQDNRISRGLTACPTSNRPGGGEVLQVRSCNQAIRAQQCTHFHSHLQVNILACV